MQRHITAEFDDLQRLHHRDALSLQKTTPFISFVTARRLTGGYRIGLIFIGRSIALNTRAQTWILQSLW